MIPADLKPGEKLRVMWSCPCPKYRGDTVEFDKPHPASSGHVFCITYEEESISFRVGDLRKLTEAEARKAAGQG